ncbi:hypothetical protein TNCV_1907501 [Trichonephila clavipes]|nr:hypothetical protein TNCV_1907501 [Trichonephila clavipes]
MPSSNLNAAFALVTNTFVTSVLHDMGKLQTIGDLPCRGANARQMCRESKSRFKLKATPNCLCRSVGDSDYYIFACPLPKDFHLVSPSQNAKKAWSQSIVRNPSIHSKLKSCIKIASTIRDQIP